MFIKNDSSEITEDIFALFLKNHGEEFEKRGNILNTTCEKCGSLKWNCKCSVGATGPRGATGATGARGVDGAIGATGPCGEDGAIGATGPRGMDGEIGATGPRGARGATGPQGIQGDTGPTLIHECGYFWNTTVPENDIFGGESLPFSDGGAHSPTIEYDEKLREVILENEGLYKVGFTVAAKSANQVTLFLNGAAVPGGTYGCDAGDSVSCGYVCLSVPAGGHLALKNNLMAPDDGRIQLRESPVGGFGTEPTVNASILIEKIG